ncbi:MAG: transcriptional regulator, Crp/Fnr family [Candidatus Rifleibacterium amylolyticum]|nr:MAG: transcriptional regulator, Crp/Fnr family [Candidatus Rifleibacterium amylolyticum]
MEDLKDRLYKLYPVLKKLDNTRVQTLLQRLKLVRLKADSPVFHELQSCEAFPFLLSGFIRVFKQSPNGRELSLYDFTPGDVCVVTAGCLLGNEPYNAMAVVKEDSELLMMPAVDFEALLGMRAFREYIFSLFSKRIQELILLVEAVAFQKLDHRLALLLLSKGKCIKVSHQELADQLGTVREMVSRLLKSFTDSGLVRLGRGRITIIDEAGLKNISVE